MGSGFPGRYRRLSRTLQNLFLNREILRRLGPPCSTGAAHVPMDGFHLADTELDRLGRRDRKGAPDTFDAAGYAALLRRLREDEEDVVYAPAFERDLEQHIAGSIPVSRAARLIITEGNYLLLDSGDWARVRPWLDEVWYCDLDPAERLHRLITRHVRFGKAPEHAASWVEEVDQRNADLIAATRAKADLVVPDTVIRSIEHPGGM
ncbi:nucleoside/nucleotide kinase family protein [Nonomuraea angiospora]|uniref:nucleoside/nucleotide kinase family protein n=1 Tax=Nonomuraea angiospora TaxID=46172 RepID=UPI0029B6A759|nr:nucleoside/nucleotide kinase family protein [Nonomuraea angiospora]MDX3111174.1 nucleoside/nucleotide kinase family protein [Nonomuraea angiospora]